MISPSTPALTPRVAVRQLYFSEDEMLTSVDSCHCEPDFDYPGRRHARRNHLEASAGLRRTAQRNHESEWTRLDNDVEWYASALIPTVPAAEMLVPSTGMIYFM